jgi:predicted hydrocarbon binding protein
MAVKDRLVSWFIKNVIAPGMEIIDQPGFIVLKLSDKRETTYLRELLFPEDVLVELEKQISKKYGSKGRQVLYSIGKKFGYRYASSSKYPLLKNTSEKEFLNFIYMLVRYIETTFAKRLTHKIDIKNKTVYMTLDNFVICRQSGIGYIMTSGGVSGICAYMFCDDSIEGVETACQGRGAKVCELICAPASILKQKKMKFIEETNYKNLDMETNYESMNKTQVCQYSHESFKSMLDSGFFKYTKGVVEHNGRRFFLCESSLMYIIENELRKIPGAENTLFQIAFDFGQKVIDSGNLNEKFIADFMSSIGFGDIYITKKNKKYMVVTNFFPWMKFYDSIKFTLFRGILSGMLSKYEKIKISLDKIEKEVSGGHLTVILSQ